jgi:hypothetical protein
MDVTLPLDNFIRAYSSPERLLRRSTSDSYLMELSSRSSVPKSASSDAMNPYTRMPIKQRQQQCVACSKSIPIPSRGLRRTPSELQLLSDEATADYQDYCMYVRIVKGMTHSKGGGSDDDPRSLANAVANAHSVQNIIRARHLPVPYEDSTFSLPDDCYDDLRLQEWQVCSSCGTAVDSEDHEGIFILDM